MPAYLRKNGQQCVNNSIGQWHLGRHAVNKSGGDDGGLLFAEPIYRIATIPICTRGKISQRAYASRPNQFPCGKPLLRQDRADLLTPYFRANTFFPQHCDDRPVAIEPRLCHGTVARQGLQNRFRSHAATQPRDRVTSERYLKQANALRSERMMLCVGRPSAASGWQLQIGSHLLPRRRFQSATRPRALSTCVEVI